MKGLSEMVCVYLCLFGSERTARKLFRDRRHGYTRVLGFLFLRNEEPNETITIKMAFTHMLVLNAA